MDISLRLTGLDRSRIVVSIALLLSAIAVLSCSAATEHTVEPYRSNSLQGLILSTRAAAECLLLGQNDRVMPIRSFATDGCSLFPDTEWNLSCCVEHDIAYWCGGDAEARNKADAALGRCVAENENALMGWLMETGARIGGHPIFPTAFRWGYGHPYRPFYPSAVADD